MGKDLRGNDIGAGFYQRKKDGRYAKRFYVDGIRHEVYGATLKECKNEYKQKLISIAKGENLASGKVTLDEYFNHWLDQQLNRKAIKESSYSLYRNHYKHIGGAIGKKRVDKVTPIDVEQIQTQMLQDGYAVKSINSVIGLLASVYNDMVKKDAVIKSPCRAIEPLKEGKKNRTNARALSREEEAAFIEAAREYWYYNAVRLLFATGMRSGELRGLQWGDYDLKRNVLHIRRTASVDKNGKAILQDPKTANGFRDIPLNDEIKGILRDQRQQVTACFGGKVIGLNECIFRSTEGKMVSRNVLKTEFNLISERVRETLPGFERISPHACRHTFITKHILEGYNEYVIKDVVGHAHSAKVTADVYLHRNAEAMKGFMENIGNAQ